MNMEKSPNFAAELRAARERGDAEAVKDVLRRSAEWQRTHPAARRADVAADLRRARADAAPKDAEAIVMDALKQSEAHRLDPDDLIWVVAKVGAWESSWRAGQAITAWLYHHGPVHPALIETAKEIARHDNAEWLDDVLLWLEPTPERWVEHARWVNALLGCDAGRDIAREGLEGPAAAARSGEYAVQHYGGHAKRVVDERGAGALRSLRAAVGMPDLELLPSGVRSVLEAWAEAFA